MLLPGVGNVTLDKFSTDLAICDAFVIDRLTEELPTLLAADRTEILKLARVFRGVLTAVLCGDRTTKNPPLKTISSDFSSLGMFTAGTIFDCFFLRAAENVNTDLVSVFFNVDSQFFTDNKI